MNRQVQGNQKHEASLKLGFLELTVGQAAYAEKGQCTISSTDQINNDS